MKRKIIALLTIAFLLIAGTASAERYLYPIVDYREEAGEAYRLIPGSAIVNESESGKFHVEARVVVKNTLTHTADYSAPGVLVGYSPSTGAIVTVGGYVARPEYVAADGYSLLTFSDYVEMEHCDDWVFSPYFTQAHSSKTPTLIGAAAAELEPSPDSGAVRAYRYLDDLPVAVYQGIILFWDAENRFMWAEKFTLNTELGTKASTAMEAYEVETFRKYGREPASAEIVIQQK